MIYTNGNLRGYEALKHTAKALGEPITNLLALARQNDPFFCGSPTQTEMATWFVSLWQRFSYNSGIHLRRVHYQLVSQRQPTKHNGEPYENTEGCWDYLCAAGKYARSLGLIDAHAFEDHRNADPIVHAYYAESFGPALQKPEWISFALPSIDSDLAWDLSLAVPRVGVSGYEYSAGCQPYHVEVWAEKSTMNDVLLPLCQRYGVNLVTSVGFQSITSSVELLQRVRANGKPARVLYISDFDPAGDSMPVAVARQVEFWRSTYAPEAELKLQPVVLTAEQVREHRLPRIPIKESDRRKDGFEGRYGEGAVELDALEALYPGQLARIITEEILPYRDLQLERRYQEAGVRAAQRVSEQWRRLTQSHQAELDELQQRAFEIVQSYEERLSLLDANLQGELAPIEERLHGVQQAIQYLLSDFEPDLPTLPEPQAPGQEESGWLFDSERDYFDQLAVYKQRKVGEE